MTTNTLVKDAMANKTDLTNPTELMTHDDNDLVWNMVAGSERPTYNGQLTLTHAQTVEGYGSGPSRLTYKQ